MRRRLVIAMTIDSDDDEGTAERIAEELDEMRVWLPELASVDSMHICGLDATTYLQIGES